MDARDAESAALRRALRSRLGLLGAPLQILAEDVLGEDDARIDWVAIEPDGRLCVALLGTAGGGETLLVRGLVQRAWMHARIADWQKLAPGIAARADLRPRLLLLAPEFSRVVRIAAREADAECLQLARFRWVAAGDGDATLALERLEPLSGPRVAAPAAPPPLASAFRSGLRERDFGGDGGRESR